MEYGVRDTLTTAKKQLLNANVPNAVNDAEFLLAYVLGVSRSQLIQQQYLSKDQYDIYVKLIERRALRESMDSLIGFTDFLDIRIPFSVDVLSPRQETELMVDDIIRENSDREKLDILDLCTGSGCIGLALCRHLNANVTLADISDSAIENAKNNAQLNQLEARFVISNLFDNIEGDFDIIVSNPPYIPSKEIELLEKEVLDYDPILALDGGCDGLEFYREIISKSVQFLRPDGRIYLEFGINQAQEIYDLMKGKFTDIEIVKDYSGIERYIKGKRI